MPLALADSNAQVEGSAQIEETEAAIPRGGGRTHGGMLARVMRGAVLGLGSWMCLFACGSPPPAEEPDWAPDAESPRELEAREEPAAPEHVAVDAAPASEVVPDDGAREPEENAAETPTPAEKPPGNTVAETRTSAVIQKVVLDNRQRVRDCYELERRNDPALEGTLTIQFEIDPSGRVSKASLNAPRSTLRQPSLVNCAIAAVQRMKFPPSSRGFESTVNYPFDFRP